LVVFSMTQPLKHYLGHDATLRQLAQSRQQLLVLQAHYEQIVPDALRATSAVLSISEGTLTLTASNGGVAAKLRQMAGGLTQDFQQRGVALLRVQVRVQVDNTPPPKRLIAPHIGDTGKAEIAQLADHLGDSPLKSALEKLLKQAR
jgi:Dna[CI] antecedent, DciA